MSSEVTAPAPSLGSSSGDAIDLQSYWRTMARRRSLIGAFFAAAVLTTAVVTFRQTRIFDAVCTIIIDLAAPRVLDKEQVQEVAETGSGGSWFGREYYETQYKVLTSRAVLQRVADLLSLSTNPRFLGLTDVKDPALLEQRRASIDPVDILMRDLKIEPVKDSRIVRIRYESDDPQLSAMVANAIADAYIAETLSVRSVTTQSASEWLEQQLAELERKLDESGGALFEFKKKHDIVAASWEDRQSMVTQRLAAANDALSRTRVRRAEYQARFDAVTALQHAPEGSFEAEVVPGVANSGVIQQLKMRLTEARSECETLGQRYLEDHPQFQSCGLRVSFLKRAIDREVETALKAVANEYADISITEKNLTRLLDATKTEAFALNQYEQEYLELKRTHENNQRLYEAILRRLKDTGVSQMLQASNVRVLDRARAAERPVRPNIPRNMAMAVFVGLLGGIALAFFAESLDRTISSQQQIEEQLGLAFLGIVPRTRREGGVADDLIVHTEPKGAAAECLRSVRTNLLFMSPDKPLKTVLITSSAPQEGKTTTATALAITMAGTGERVLLVDADMRRPRLHKVFGIVGNQAGLSSLILGEGDLESVTRETEVPGLTVLPCGPVPPNPAELLHTAAFRKLLSRLAGTFDRVILDSPPVGVVSDAAVISTLADGTLVVLKAGSTARESARQAVRQLIGVNAKLLGAVLNDLNLADQRYGRYAYLYQYGYYDADREPAGRTKVA